MRISVVLVLLSLACWPGEAGSQVRVTPKGERPDRPARKPAELPPEFRGLKVPEWPVPTDLEQWKKDRLKVRETLWRCVGKLPERPAPNKVKVVSRKEHNDYVVERIEFHNGVDAAVAGLVVIPRCKKGPFPAVIAAHGHGGSKETVCTNEKDAQCVGPLLARKGYVVAAIDSYFCGERNPKNGRASEGDLFRVNLLKGRSLWGLMVRDQQCLLDYLLTRPDVDKERVGVTGMSMGGTTTWWLAALDERIKAAVGVAGFTRYTELISKGNVRLHGVYYFVPGVLEHFDTEAIYALVAPRPLLMLSGDRDGGLPLEGIEILEKKLGKVYRLHDKSDAFRSAVYRKTGHEYLPEMKDELVGWLNRHLAGKR